MRYIKVFAPGTVANLGCGFDVMGLTLDGVGDLLEVGIEEGAGGLCAGQTNNPCGSRIRSSKRSLPAAASGRVRLRRPQRFGA